MFRVSLGKCIEEIMSLAVGLDGDTRRIDFLLLHYHYAAVSLSNTLVSRNLSLVVIPSQCRLRLAEG